MYGVVNRNADKPPAFRAEMGKHDLAAMPQWRTEFFTGFGITDLDGTIRRGNGDAGALRRKIDGIYPIVMLEGTTYSRAGVSVPYLCSIIFGASHQRLAVRTQGEGTDPSRVAKR